MGKKYNIAEVYLKIEDGLIEPVSVSVDDISLILGKIKYLYHKSNLDFQRVFDGSELWDSVKKMTLGSMHVKEDKRLDFIYILKVSTGPVEMVRRVTEDEYFVLYNFFNAINNKTEN